MPASRLFSPIAVGGLQLANRIVIAPMCQYSAVDGAMSSWHAIHLGNLALSGAAVLTIEATAVEPEGRISYADVGLWNDATAGAMARTLECVRAWSRMPIAIQLAHAGRKASCEVPWKGGKQLAAGDARGWQTVSASAVPFAASDAAPAELGLDAVQIHAAHGYLLHQFLSPLSNQRSDGYGGSLANRMRFPLEVFDAVREAFAAERPVTVRISATDWVAGEGWEIQQSIEFSQALVEHGAAAIHVSSGGLSAAQMIPVSPGYQVPLARAIKQHVTVPVVAVGLITGFDQAEAIVATGDADLIALARTILYDPRWPWHAAAHLGAKIADAPPQYLRCEPARARGLFG